MSEEGSRLAVARPPLVGAATPPLVASTVMVVTEVIPTAVMGPAAAVTLAIPPQLITEEVRKDTELPVLPSGGTHDPLA